MKKTLLAATLAFPFATGVALAGDEVPFHALTTVEQVAPMTDDQLASVQGALVVWEASRESESCVVCYNYASVYQINASGLSYGVYQYNGAYVAQENN